MLDSIYHMTLKLIKNWFLAWKRQDFAIFYPTLYVKIFPSFTQRYNGRHNVSRKSINH